MDPSLELELVDASRGPTASQAAGLTLAAARAIVAAGEAAAGDSASRSRWRWSIRAASSSPSSGWTDLVTITLAQDKAWTALVNRMPTGDLVPTVQPDNEFYGYHTIKGCRTIIFAGGLPLERSGVLVGAVGIGGGTSAQDRRIVEAAAGAFG